MAKTARYIGTCPVCLSQVKIRKGKLVHHGYQRPGYGYIVGDCFGVGFPPNETSPECAQEWLAVVNEELVSVEDQLARLPDLTEIVVEHTAWRQGRRRPTGDKTVLTPEDGYKWTRVYEDRERELTYRIQELERESTRMVKLLDEWEPLPLLEVMEEQAKKKAVQEERKAARQAAREEKFEKKLAYYRKRHLQILRKIAKAEKKLAKEPSESNRWEVKWAERDLEQFPAESASKLRDIMPGLSRDDALAMMDELIAENLAAQPNPATTAAARRVRI